MKIAVLAGACLALFGVATSAIILPNRSVEANSSPVKVIEAERAVPQSIPSYGFSVEVLINGSPAQEYLSHGRRYVEAVAGVEYELRIRNPLPIRTAVALSVDGLNTIDARRTTAWNASKWVIGPYQSITIGGWQMSSDRARRFYFTSEKDSYGSKLGQTANLGNISAVFFQETTAEPRTVLPPPRGSRDESNNARKSPSGGSSSDSAGSLRNSGASPTESRSANRVGVDKSRQAEVYPTPNDDYAATGIGRSVTNDVRWVEMSLQRQPLTEITVRYEYQAALVRLGILPRPYGRPDPLDKREKSTGFAHERYCPEP